MRLTTATFGVALRTAARAFSHVTVSQVALGLFVLSASLLGLLPHDAATGGLMVIGSVQALREQRQAKAKEARNLLDANPGDKWTGDHQKTYDALGADIDRFDAQIANHQRQLDIEAGHRQSIDQLSDERGISRDEAESTLNQQRSDFAAWLRFGAGSLSAEQRDRMSRGGQIIDAANIQKLGRDVQAALSSGVPAEGGALVPTTLESAMDQEMKAYGGVEPEATVMNTSSGEVVNWPTSTGIRKGRIIGENAPTSERTDFNFGLKPIGAYLYTSDYVPVPFALLMDSGIDIEQFIVQDLSEAVFRAKNEHFTVGTGIGQPEGVVTASSQGKVGAAGQTASVTLDDLTDLEHAIDPAYRSTDHCRWMFHDSTLKALKKLKDGQGRPLWVPGATAGEPDKLLNYGYRVNNDMPQMAAGAKSILFGNLKRYRVRNVRGLMIFRLTDSFFTLKGQVGFVVFSRHDGRYIDAGGKALRHYQNAAA